MSEIVQSILANKPVQLTSGFSSTWYDIWPTSIIALTRPTHDQYLHQDRLAEPASLKAFSAINIVGLATGMVVTMLIALWVYDEMSFDRQQEGSDRIAQVWQIVQFDDQKAAYNVASIPLVQELRAKRATLMGENGECVSIINIGIAPCVEPCIVRKNVDPFELVLKYIYPFILSPKLHYFFSSEPVGL